MINEENCFLNALENIFTFILSWVSCGSSKHINHINKTLVLHNFNSSSSIKTVTKSKLIVTKSKLNIQKPHTIHRTKLNQII